MRLQMRFDMSGPTFQGRPTEEAARALERVAEDLRSGAEGGEVVAKDGATIGAWAVIDD